MGRAQTLLQHRVSPRIRVSGDVAESERAEAKRASPSLMRNLQGSAAQKLAMFEKLRAAGGFAKEHRAYFAETEKMLAMEKGMCREGSTTHCCARR